MLSFGWQAGARSPGGPWHPAAQGAVAWRGAAEGEPSEYQISAAELQSEDPERLARRWSEVIERPAQMRDGQRVIALDDATLRFTEATDGRAEGLGGLDLACADPTRAGLVQICGIRFRLVRP